MLKERTILFVVLISIFLTSCSNSSGMVSIGVNHRVIISNFKFIPAELFAAPGDIVIWENKDIVPHTIVADVNDKITSPELAQGQTFVYKVSKSLPYICGLHPSMKGNLIVGPQ